MAAIIQERVQITKKSKELLVVEFIVVSVNVIKLILAKVQVLKYPQPNLTTTFHHCMNPGVRVEAGFVGAAEPR